MGGVGSHGIKGNRGGRPRKTISERQVEKMMKAFARKAKEMGKDFADLLAEWAYCEDIEEIPFMTKTGRAGKLNKAKVDLKDRIRCIEIYCNYTMAKRTETTVETKKVNVVEMPAVEPDPAQKARDLLMKEFVQ